jgi:RNA polymerase sigma factor (sigma-70 family)
MSEQESVALVRSVLLKPEGTATAAEYRACAEFFRESARIARERIGRSHRGWIDSDDFVQLVLIRLTNRVKTSRFDGVHVTLAVCIARIARDIVLRHTHRFSRRREEPLAPDLAAEILDPAEGPELQVEQMQLHEDVAGLLASLRGSLSERDHRIATRRWVDDLSVTEIADELNLTEDCVTSVLYRLNLKLAERLRASA